MKKYNLILGTVIILVVISANLYSQDWPQFRGPGRDSKVTGFKAPATWPAQLKQVWKVSVGSGDATPVLSGKKIYLSTRQNTDEVVTCLDPETGKEIWKTPYPAAAVTGPSTSHPGPRSTPAVAQGKIVTFGVTGILTCLDAATGKILWKKDNPENLVPQFYTGMSPLLTEGMCIVHTGTKDKGTIAALDLATGNEKWKWEGDGPAYSSPSLMTADGKKMVVVQTEKNLVGLGLADGKLLWQIATPPQQRFYNSTSPYINGQIIYYTGQGSGTKAIQIVMDGNKFSVKELWSNPDIGAKWNTPILKDGYLYGFTDQRRIYCIDATTGKTAWLDETVNSDFATILDCGSVIIGFPSTGNLIVFKPDPKAYTEIVKYKVAETPVYAFPIISGNTIYVKDAESLAEYKIE
ncbi:MAG: PQQ-like beta-propeller repeat protein [Bacteroidota bacterium]|nr:PQQ-like beta-propeller repeat protein [Bacteroidota bacterium]